MQMYSLFRLQFKKKFWDTFLFLPVEVSGPDWYLFSDIFYIKHNRVSWSLKLMMIPAGWSAWRSTFPWGSACRPLARLVLDTNLITLSIEEQGIKQHPWVSNVSVSNPPCFFPSFFRNDVAFSIKQEALGWGNLGSWTRTVIFVMNLQTHFRAARGGRWELPGLVWIPRQSRPFLSTAGCTQGGEQRRLLKPKTTYINLFRYLCS
jgi:hypothetical protein